MRKRGFGLAALAACLLSGTALGADKIKVGVTATLEGTYTILGVDGIAGFNAAVKKYGSTAGGASSNSSSPRPTPRRIRRCARSRS